MKSDRIIEEYVQKLKIKFAIDEQTRMPLHVVADKNVEMAQLELFSDLGLSKPELDWGDDDGSDRVEQPAKEAGCDHDARGALVVAALRIATTPSIRRRLNGSGSLVVVVDVPSAAWVGPFESYFDHELFGHWATYARDGSNRGRDKAGVGNDEAAKRISAGRRVVGIAPNPTVYLPEVLQGLPTSRSRLRRRSAPWCARR